MPCNPLAVLLFVNQAGGGFRGIQYSHSVANFYDDQDNRPVASWHPRITDVVYYGERFLSVFPSPNKHKATQRRKRERQGTLYLRRL